MNNQKIIESKKELETLCITVRKLIGIQDYQECERLICLAMGKYPHAPQTHNLMGVLLEKKGDHLMAMKHFRASSALDCNYLPVRQNLECYGTFFSHGKCAYDESDCLIEENNCNYKVEYDIQNIGHVVRRI